MKPLTDTDYMHALHLRMWQQSDSPHHAAEHLLAKFVRYDTLNALI